MPRLILLLLVLYALWYGWQYVKSRPPGERKRVIWVWGSVALVVICSILVATGRLHWIAAALAALIPMGQALLRWLPRVFPMLKFMQKKGFAPSTLRTRGLEVTFNLATGETRGRVFEGPFDGHELEALSEEQLREQFAWFQNNDRQSALLLRTYMLKRGFSGFDTAGSERESSSPSRGDLSREEAYQILGLEPGASSDDIVKAHKRLIQKLHPDRGGNDYLAAKINAAKDILVS